MLDDLIHMDHLAMHEGQLWADGVWLPDLKTAESECMRPISTQSMDNLQIQGELPIFWHGSSPQDGHDKAIVWVVPSRFAIWGEGGGGGYPRMAGMWQGRMPVRWYNMRGVIQTGKVGSQASLQMH